MSLRHILVFFVSFLMLLSAVPSAEAMLNTEIAVIGTLDEQHHLKLRVGTFDPIDETPIPQDQKARSPTDFLVIQFDGPIQDDWRLSLEHLGCQIIWYLPEDAYLVLAHDVSVEYLTDLPHVRYIGPYHPGYKLAPELFQGPEPQVIYITPLRDTAPVVHAVKELGGTVTALGTKLVRASIAREHLVELAFEPEVGFIEPGGGGSFLNDNDARILYARQAVNGNFTNDGLSLWSWNGTAFQGITGKDVKVMVTDTGIDGTHPAFDGRKVFFSPMGSPYSNWTDYMGHGTHCAGTVLGDGSWRPPPAAQGEQGLYTGIAPEALLLGQIINWDANDDLMYGATVEDLINVTQQQGAQVSSNSWSCCGVVQTYGITSQIYDDAVRDSNVSAEGDQSLVYVFAAGNSGAGNIITPGVAKNVITVGATGDQRGGYDENYLTGFSSKGPTADGRRKPDIVAPGLYIMSALANNPNFSYTSASGTSMATPGVAGASALVIDFFNRTYGLSPSPAMVKSVLVNGADQLNNSNYKYADSNQGWGRVNLSRSLLETAGRKVWGEDQKHLLATGASVDYYFNVTSSNELRVHMAYTDPGAAPAAMKALVNDLDLIAFAPNGTRYNASYFVNDYSAPGGTPDSLNNVEGLRFKDPALGQWHIRVSATNVPNGPQDYAITVNGWTDLSYHDIDLRALDVAFLTTSPVEGDKVQWSASFQNDALVTAYDVTYTVKLDGHSIQAGVIPSMVRHKVAVLSGVWPSERGDHTMTLEVDTIGLVKETDETNNQAAAELFVHNFGLTVNASHLDVIIPSEGAALWYVTINNTGTLADTYSVSWDPLPTDWSLNLCGPSEYSLDPGSNTTVCMALTPHGFKIAGEAATTNIKVTSTGLPSLGASVPIWASVAKGYGLTMSAAPENSTLRPGGKATFTIKLTNDGNTLDIFTLDTDVKTSGTASFIVSSATSRIAIGPNETATIPLDVYVDNDAFAGAGCTINVTATSVGDPSSSDSGAVEVQVDKVPSLASAISPDVVIMDHGETTEHDLVIYNNGNTQEIVTYSVLLPGGWTEEKTALPRTLLPFTSVHLPLTFHRPTDALSGDYRITVTTMNVGVATPGRISDHDLLITIPPVHDIEFLVTSSMLNGTAGYRFQVNATIKNIGNIVEHVQVSVFGLNGTWVLTSDRSTFTLFPGEQAVFVGLVQTTQGTEGNHSIQIRAYFGQCCHKTGDVPMTLHAPPPPPPPVVPLPPPPPKKKPDNRGMYIMVGILVAVIIAMVIIALLVMRFKKRPAEAPTVPAKPIGEPPT